MAAASETPAEPDLTEAGTRAPAVQPPAPVTDTTEARAKPPWVDRFVWSALWKAVVVVAAVTALTVAATRAGDLLRTLVVSGFFALALIPAVNYIHGRWGWRRGAAVGVVYLVGVVSVVLLVVVLIPGIVAFADAVSQNADQLVGRLNDRFGTSFALPATATDAASGSQALSEWGQRILGFASSGVAFAFTMLQVAMFTFYFAADYPRIERAALSRMSPDRQRFYGWVTDTSIQQTGGYFYSRALLMLINGSLSFLVMLLVGLDAVYALPLAVFMGFVSEFIPAIGTYIGGAIPIAFVLVAEGLTPALVLLGWVLVYQQLENLFLSPRLSAKTMEVNGAVAFGAALAGGAIAGPMGAFMALPVAAMITALIKNTGTRYDVVYQTKYDADQIPTAPAGASNVAPS